MVEILAEYVEPPEFSAAEVTATVSVEEGPGNTDSAPEGGLAGLLDEYVEHVPANTWKITLPKGGPLLDKPIVAVSVIVVPAVTGDVTGSVPTYNSVE